MVGSRAEVEEGRQHHVITSVIVSDQISGFTKFTQLDVVTSFRAKRGYTRVQLRFFAVVVVVVVGDTLSSPGLKPYEIINQYV